MIHAIRTERPRLFRPADDPEFRFRAARDPVRRRILQNLLADCRQCAAEVPPARLADRVRSPHPFHQLYVTFYEGMRAQALIEQYVYAWKFTGDPRWLALARRWLHAACRWEHSDRVEEHFYTANRYMNAFAVALDVLHDRLTEREKATITACLLKMMRRWWPEVEQQKDSAEAGHHAIIDNAHFGLAALALLGEIPEAEAWVEAVVHRARRSLFVQPCGKGGAPWDGPMFWSAENMWRVQFAEALRNVTGIDLFREFRRQIIEPLHWLRYHLSPTGCGSEPLDQVAAPLLSLARLGEDRELYGRALAEPRLGRIRHYGQGVKGSKAECILAWGPYAYMFHDPAFQPASRAVRCPPSRMFPGAREWDEEAVLRDGSTKPRWIALVNGAHMVGGGVTTGLQVQVVGKQVFKTLSAPEYQPLGMGTHVRLGGCDEAVAHVSAPEPRGDWEYATAGTTHAMQEYWLLRRDPAVLLMAARRKPRGIQLREEAGIDFARLDGIDGLQYRQQPWFHPDAGELRMKIRFPAVGPHRALFHAASAGGLCAGNSFLIEFGDGGLTFELQSQMWHRVFVSLPKERGGVEPGTWHELAARWGGLNEPGAKPFIELEWDGRTVRQDDPAEFGEMKSNAQGLAPHSKPRTFYCRPNTALTFGARVQVHDGGTACDLARIEVRCPGCPPLVETFAAGLELEAGSGALDWCLTPVQVARITHAMAKCRAGSTTIVVHPIAPAGLALTGERVPYAPSGFAAGSLKFFKKENTKPSTRIIASAGKAGSIVLLLAEARSRVRARGTPKGFDLWVRKRKYCFVLVNKGSRVLSGV